MARDFFLRRLGPVLDAFARDEVHAVIATAHHVARYVIGDDPVGALRPPLGDGMLNDVLSLRGKADEEPWTLRTNAKLGEDVAGRCELELGRTVAFLELRRRNFDAPVGDRRNQDRRLGRK